jgi:hypothetical protein
LPVLPEIFQGLQPLNTWEDVYDVTVLERNGLMMYGCKKPASHQGQPKDALAYDLTMVLAASCVEEEGEGKEEPDALPEEEPAALPEDEPDALPEEEPAALPEEEPDALPKEEPDVLPQEHDAHITRLQQNHSTAPPPNRSSHVDTTKIVTLLMQTSGRGVPSRLLGARSAGTNTRKGPAKNDVTVEKVLSNPRKRVMDGARKW